MGESSLQTSRCLTCSELFQYDRENGGDARCPGCDAYVAVDGEPTNNVEFQEESHVGQ